MSPLGELASPLSPLHSSVMTAPTVSVVAGVAKLKFRQEAARLGVKAGAPFPGCMAWDQVLKAVSAHRLRELNSWLLGVEERMGEGSWGLTCPHCYIYNE